MFIAIFLIFSLLSVSIDSHEIQSQPVPQTYDGLLIYGTQRGATNYFLLEAFYDLLDPDSASSFSLLQSIIIKKNLTKQTNFNLIVHFFPSPNNINSYPITIGMKYIQDQFGVALATSYMNLIFAKQSQFWSTSSMSQSSVETKLAQLVMNQTAFSAKFNQSTFSNALQNSTYDGEVRVGWKYGCSRNIYETPAYFANGIYLNNADEYDEEDWDSIFSQFFP